MNPSDSPAEVVISPCLVISIVVSQSRIVCGLEGPDTQVMFASEFSRTVKYPFVSSSLDMIETFSAGTAK